MHCLKFSPTMNDDSRTPLEEHMNPARTMHSHDSNDARTPHERRKYIARTTQVHRTNDTSTPHQL